MGLYADICRAGYCCKDDIAFDEASGTWTVQTWELDGEKIPGIPSKEMAEAIVRAIGVGYSRGVDAAGYS